MESDSSVSGVAGFLLIDAQTELIIDGQLKAVEQLGHVNAKGSQLLYLSSSLVANKREVEGSLLVASFDLLRY